MSKMPETQDGANKVKPWVVLKFGGTSVSYDYTWKQIAERVKELEQEYRVWVVISALTNVSNRLEKSIEEILQHTDNTPIKFESLDWIRQTHYKLAASFNLTDTQLSPLNELLGHLKKLLKGISLLKEASPKARAKVMAHGELLSTLLGIPILQMHGIDVAFVDARNLLETTIRINEQEADKYLEGTVLPSHDPAPAEKQAGEHGVVLTQGFIAKTPRGDTCILGRGGSDTSASLFGALLGAARVEIWTDVHGMFTTDPNSDPSARLIRQISYREAEELAAAGAKVLHPRCIGPCRWANIPLEIKNTWDPKVVGTRIVNANLSDSKPVVMAVVRLSNVILISLTTLEMWGATGFLARVFSHFDALGISVDLVGTSQSTVTVTLDRIPGGILGDTFQDLKSRLSHLGEVVVVHPCAVVSVVGRKIRTVLPEIGKSLDVFKEKQVYLISDSSENLNMSFVVESSVASDLVKELHSRLLPKEGHDDIFGESWNLLKEKQIHKGPVKNS